MGLNRSNRYITWIHHSKRDPHSVMRFSSSTGGTYLICNNISEEILNYVICPVKGKCDIDGIISLEVQTCDIPGSTTNMSNPSLNTTEILFDWFLFLQMASQCKSKIHEDLYNVKKFHIASWTIDKYKSATTDLLEQHYGPVLLTISNGIKRISNHINYSNTAELIINHIGQVQF